MARVVVRLQRGDDVWHIDVPDAESDEQAADIALRHANGFFDPIAGCDVEPSNGEAGWKITSLMDELPHETEWRRSGVPEWGLESDAKAHGNERKPKPHWSRRKYGYGKHRA